MKDLKKGDILTGGNIATGEFQGYSQTEVGETTIEVAIIFEPKKQITHMVPMTALESFEQLPSKEYYQKRLKYFDKEFSTEFPREFETNRYEYIKQINEKGGIKAFFEALRTLLYLQEQKIITIAEKKLLNKYREKFYSDMEMILGQSKDEAKMILRNCA